MKTCWTSAMVLTAAALVAVAGGCQQTSQETPKPAPVQPGKPAPAPRATSNVMYLPTGEEATSALMLWREMPAEAVVGQNFTYTLRVKNISKLDLGTVSVRENCNPGQVISADPAFTGTAPADMMWAFPLKAGETRDIKITVRPNAVGTVQSCATASFISTLCASTTIVQPALAITKTMRPEGLVCDPIPGEIVVTNTGSGAATNVKVTDQLPQGLTSVDGKTALSFDVGTLAKGESKRIPLSLKGSARGRFENDAMATADGGLKAQSARVATVLRQPQLELACKAPAQIVAGRDARFELTVTNKGDAACDTTVTVPMPAGATFVSATEGGAPAGTAITWRVAGLAPNTTRTVAFVLRPTGLNSIAVNASATCPCSNTAPTNCTTNVVGIPAMLLDGSDEPDPVEVGGTTTYTLRVTNQSGVSPLTNIRLVAKMSDADKMQAISFVGPTGNGTLAGNTITFPAIATLAPREMREFKIVVRATAAGQVQLEATAVSNEITRPLVKTETTNFFQ